MLNDLYSTASAFSLNLTIILLSICIYLSFYIDKIYQMNETKNQLILSTIASITTLLCMSFPIPFYGNEYFYDLCFVPFLLAAIYGGPIPAIGTTVSMISFRYLLGGEGFYVTLIVQTICLLAFLFIHLKVKKYTFRFILNLSILFTVSLGFLIFFVGNIIFTSFQNDFSIQFYAKFVTFQVITQLAVFLITTKLIEGLLNKIRSRNYLMQTHRLQAITDLTASVAHEVRNPLTVANGFLQLLMISKSLTTKEHEYVQFINRELNMVGKIVDEYIRIAHPSKLKFTPTHLSKVLHHLSKELTTLCNAHHAKINICIKKDGLFYTDEEKLQETLRNIITNGIEAMPNGGTILINANVSKKLVTIQVNDEGIGMSNEELDRIGTPFYSLKEKGTGLGLMLCYQIVSTMGGRIEVTSQKGFGSTFTIHLPTQLEHLLCLNTSSWVENNRRTEIN